LTDTFTAGESASDSASLKVPVTVIIGGVDGKSNEFVFSFIKSLSNLLFGALPNFKLRLGGGEPAGIDGGDGVCTISIGTTIFCGALGLKSSSEGKQMIGICSELGGRACKTKIVIS
jgi:hypothetical protein